MKIAVVIVLYNPSAEQIDRICNNAEISNALFVVVDNSIESHSRSFPDSVLYVPNYCNLGIATAQNIGVLKASEHRCTHVCFFDQDSGIVEGFIDTMYNEYVRLSKSYPNLFILGPRVCNEKTGVEYKSVIHKEHYSDIGFQKKREIISSGSITSINLLKEVGLMDETLFIDYVDFELCWRANQKQYICGITDAVCLNHNVGRNTLYLGNYLIIISSPFRYFYQYRNYLWLIRRKYVPLQWKINTGVKYVLRLVYFPIFIKNGCRIAKYMIKGFLAGLIQSKDDRSNNSFI